MHDNLHDAGAGCASAGGPAAGSVHAVSDFPQSAAHTPAGEGAGCVGAEQAGSPAERSPPQTLREFERALRGLGFCRRQAEQIARHGFALRDEAPPEAPPHPLPDLQSAAERLLRSLKGLP